MKPLIKIFIYFFIVISVNNYAQEYDFNLENLKAPSMPSATILGTQVNDVNSPKSMKDLETAVFANYFNSGQGLTIPNNYALEINPFMLSGMKNFNCKSYLDNEPLTNMWRNLSISIATTNKFLIKDSVPTNAVGLSLRTIILNGEPSKKVSDAFLLALAQNSASLDINAIVRLQLDECIKTNSKDTTIEDICNCIIQQIKASAEFYDINGITLTGNELANQIADAERIIRLVFEKIDKRTPQNKVEDEFDKIYKELKSTPVLETLRKSITGVKTIRYGLRWDINWAIALNFPTNNFDFCIVPRWGAWTNLSYQSEDMESLAFIVLGRYIINNDNFINNYQPVEGNFNTGNIYDIGLKVNYEINRFSLDLQYIYRLNTNKITKIIDGEAYERTVKNDSRKYLLGINYNMTDDIVLSYNIGKDFNEISKSQGDLISGLSINLGFGNIKANELINKLSRNN